MLTDSELFLLDLCYMPFVIFGLVKGGGGGGGEVKGGSAPLSPFRGSTAYIYIIIYTFSTTCILIHVRGSSFFLGKVTALGVLCCFTVLLCLVCLFDLACLLSHLKTCIGHTVYTCTCQYP